MEKIAIIFCGPIRPDWQSVKANIDLLKKSFENFNVTTYLCSWNDPTILSNIDVTSIDNLILFKEPEKNFIASQVWARIKQGGASFERNYKAFWSRRQILEIVKNSDIVFDWIVLSRTDLKIYIEEPKTWLIKGCYSMPTQARHYKKEVVNPVNDQFGIADPNTMYDAWNYKDMNTYNRLYNMSVNPEHTLKFIMEMNRVTIVDCTADHYDLNLARHTNDSTYSLEAGELKYFIKRTLGQIIKKILGKRMAQSFINNIKKLFL
jgi:hypothetical protein